MFIFEKIIENYIKVFYMFGNFIGLKKSEYIFVLLLS
jgi:hypothetical protein